MDLGEGGGMELRFRFFSRPLLTLVYCHVRIVEGSEKLAILIFEMGKDETVDGVTVTEYAMVRLKIIVETKLVKGGFDVACKK